MASARLGWLWIVLAVRAQDIDTVVSSQDRRPFTFVDQIEDGAERRAFVQLYAPHSPSKKLRLADSFLERYPQSWLLPFVYEISAKSAIEAGDDDLALEHASASLALLPENPLLLVPLATLYLKRERTAEAAESAARALEYLERFARPPTIAPSEWPALRSQLAASAHYSRGRAMVTEALDRNRDRTLLRLAGFHLQHSLRLQPGHQDARRLLSLFRSIEPVPPPPATRRQPEYAGTAACSSCHAREHGNWSHTGMARMLRPYSPAAVIGDFSKASPHQDWIRPLLRDGRHCFMVRSGDGEHREFPVTHTIGSKWQQAYVTRSPEGRPHVVPIQYNVIEKAWFNYWQVIDPPGSGRADPAAFHRLSPDTGYMQHCAPCHTSQLSGARPEQVRFREEGVNCEMCHGPSAAHAAMPRAKPPLEPPVDFQRVSAEDYVAICAQCHAQSALRETGNYGERNYQSEGQTFFVRYQARPLVEFSRRAFHKDGRFAETTFIVEAFLRTKCFRKGGATCGSCHHPHPDDAATNPASLKFRNEPDRMCRQCHTAIDERHARHAPGSEASRCVTCHMPKIMRSVLFSARTHQIDDIPSAAMTARFGRAASPNVCLDCHQDKDVAWLQRH
jgi:hypothetical protein